MVVLSENLGLVFFSVDFLDLQSIAAGVMRANKLFEY